MENENLLSGENTNLPEIELSGEQEVTIPEAPENSEQKTGITLKFNKELREIPYGEAVVLAQKGLKYDSILPEWGRLKVLAQESGKSIADYLSQAEKSSLNARREQLLLECGGNEAVADRLLELENAAGTSGQLLELKREFPEIESLEALPDGVKALCEDLSVSPLNAMLLYNHRAARAAAEAAAKQHSAASSSLGSQNTHRMIDSADDEFVRGLWGNA